MEVELHSDVSVSSYCTHNDHVDRVFIHDETFSSNEIVSDRTVTERLGMSAQAKFHQQPTSWEPNFTEALPIIFIALSWLLALCFTLPSRSSSWRVIRLCSFPPLLYLLLQLSFEYRYTLGNPLRDLALPTITWSLVCKAVELCLTYSDGGPRPIRPFLKESDHSVDHMSEAHYADYEWRTVDFPALWSYRRAIYALDVFGLRRVGTSWLLPSEGRSLEWSKDALNDWSRYLQGQNIKPNQVSVHGPVHRFGQPEASLIFSAVQVLFVVIGFGWIYALAAPSAPIVCIFGLYIPILSSASQHEWAKMVPWAQIYHLSGIPDSAFELPLPTRLGLVLTFGGAVCFAAGLVESLVLALLGRPKPVTMFVSAFEQPLTSPSISRLWARSWHSMSQRDYTNMASLCPGSRNRILFMFYVFMWSGVQHSWMFSRLQTPPPTAHSFTSILRSMFDPGMMTFFLSQATGIAVERALLASLPVTWKRNHPTALRRARKTWMIIVLISPGPFFVDSVLKRRLMTKHIMQGFTPSALLRMAQGKTY